MHEAVQPERDGDAAAAEPVLGDELLADQHPVSVGSNAANAEADAAAEPVHSRYQLWHEAEKLAQKNVGTKQWKLFVDAQDALWSETEQDENIAGKRLRELQKEYKANQLTFKRDGTDVAYADIIGNIVACVDNAKGLLAAAARLDPTKAAGLVWAGVETLLSVGCPQITVMTR